MSQAHGGMGVANATGSEHPTIFIWGMGLIGTSLALRLRDHGFKISGAVRSEKSRLVLRRLGFENIYTDEQEILAGLKTADILILGLNLKDAEHALSLALTEKEALSRLLIFDICSTKAEICAYVSGRFPGANFIGAHPMAGKERQGPEAAESDLFEGSTVYLTPLAHHPPELRAALVRRASEIWQITGAKTATIDAAEHDRIMASVSHGLHLVSCLIANLSAAALNPPPALSPAAGSYRDMTRITQSSGAMWSEIIQSNKTHVTQWLKALGNECTALAASIEAGKADVEKLFSQAQEARAKVMRT